MHCTRSSLHRATRFLGNRLSRRTPFSSQAPDDDSAIADLFQHHAIKNDSGSPSYLDLDGMKSIMESIGRQSCHKQLFRHADQNGDGRLEWEEFSNYSREILAGSPARIVLVVGGPGSGKGLLSERLQEECNIIHLSSGDMLREEVKMKTPLGQQVQEIMERGDLVSSAVIVTLIQKRMRDHPGKRVLLDGFPRSLENAQDLMELCGKPELALHLNCDDTILMERILKRGKEGNRSDDNIETALLRLRTYHKYHHTQMDWLREQGVPIVNLDCSGTPDNVWDQLLAIGRLMRPAAGTGSLFGDESDSTDDDDDDDRSLRA